MNIKNLNKFILKYNYFNIALRVNQINKLLKDIF